MTLNKTNNIARRTFIQYTTLTSVAVLSAPLISGASSLLQAGNPVTVGEIMDAFIKEVPIGPITNTVDTLKAGSRDTKVTGIVTTMFATIDLIKKAIALNANFIIAHEPTFYNHLDNTQWLEGDDVYEYKKHLLDSHGITVWRNHDHIHSLAVDGVRKGVVDALGWQKYGEASQPLFVLRPGLSLGELIRHAKHSLDINMVRYIGNPAEQVSKVLLMPGAAGGTRQIESIRKYQPDVLMCGEISEWETAEYVRDARAAGKKLSLVLLGHIASEEPGSEYMANWLHEKYPSIKTTHIPSGNALAFL